MESEHIDILAAINFFCVRVIFTRARVLWTNCTSSQWTIGKTGSSTEHRITLRFNDIFYQ